MNISFIGAGTLAQSLGNLFQQAGHQVFYSSPTPEAPILSIAAAIEKSNIICCAIPYKALAEVLPQYEAALANKIVIDSSNPIHLDTWAPIFLGEDSAGEQTARLLPNSKVVKAFNSIFADAMTAKQGQIQGQPLTAFIAADDATASATVAQLAETIGFVAVQLKGLQQARHLEALAHLNISIALAGGGTSAGFVYVQEA